jgi:serine/threonine-protein kinase RsbT
MSQSDAAPPSMTIAIGGEDGIVTARQQARALARELGFGMVDQSRIATAVSELARNVVRYATDGQGEVVIRELRSEANAPGLEVVVHDQGPGISDIKRAMQEGYSSGAGLGLGLSGTKRLVDEFFIDSAAGRGTMVTIRKWRR